MAITLSRIPKHRKNKELEAGVYGYIIFKVTDHGKVVMRRKRQMHSLTALWFVLLWSGYSHTTPSIEAYEPNSFTISNPISFPGTGDAFWLVASSPYVGIVVGTGQMAKNPQDYTLAAPVTSSSTGLSYSPMTMSSPTVSGNTSTLSMSRVFTNNGSPSITLTEAAIIVYISNGDSTTPGLDAAIAYDYISPSITLASGQTLTVTYQIQVTMRRGDTPWISHRFHYSYWCWS